MAHKNIPFMTKLNREKITLYKQQESRAFLPPTDHFAGPYRVDRTAHTPDTLISPRLSPQFNYLNHQAINQNQISLF